MSCVLCSGNCVNGHPVRSLPSVRHDIHRYQRVDEPLPPSECVTACIVCVPTCCLPTPASMWVFHRVAFTKIEFSVSQAEAKAKHCWNVAVYLSLTCWVLSATTSHIIVDAFILFILTVMSHGILSAILICNRRSQPVYGVMIFK